MKNLLLMAFGFFFCIFSVSCTSGTKSTSTKAEKMIEYSKNKEIKLPAATTEELEKQINETHPELLPGELAEMLYLKVYNRPSHTEKRPDPWVWIAQTEFGKEYLKIAKAKKTKNLYFLGLTDEAIERGAIYSSEPLIRTPNFWLYFPIAEIKFTIIDQEIYPNPGGKPYLLIEGEFESKLTKEGLKFKDFFDENHSLSFNLPTINLQIKKRKVVFAVREQKGEWIIQKKLI